MLHSLIVRAMPLVPRPIMRRVASRYIAGETLEQALERVGHFARAGYPGVLDLLGEDVREEREARRALTTYRAAADGIAERSLDCHVSVKPTHFGLNLDSSLALELYAELAAHCRERGVFLRVEMEDHPTTDATLRVFGELHSEHPNVGIVLQSRLLRTTQDIDSLSPEGLDVRMVKGVYIEPEDIAHTEPEPIRAAFVAACERLWERGARVCLATHDQALGARLILSVGKLCKSHEDYEFQVLMGVQEALWERWRTAGHPVRVYVPFGPQWRAYSQRRLSRNPDLLRAVLRNAFR
ncbi:MAG: proline dehydrogenase [Planctomycetes bacterium]|jgi:proline dehydrogenase|nr:proline dehydrogenase [Planctomycetota bacterium]MDP6409590.1 proline dehydrogenase family protein [Planctomycetota bacterium]